MIATSKEGPQHQVFTILIAESAFRTVFNFLTVFSTMAVVDDGELAGVLAVMKCDEVHMIFNDHSTRLIIDEEKDAAMNTKG